MKCRKFLFIAMIFIISLLCVSAVSAADDSSVSDIVADTNDVTVLEDSIDDASLGDSQGDENVLTEDPVQSKTFTELKDTIDSAQNEIELESDYKYTEQDNLPDGITINHDLTINGNGHTIDGNSQARLFHVIDNAVVTFNNITFVNGSAQGGFGAAIWAEDTATVKAINCNFINNSADLGGALYRNVSAENCIFIKNHANQDGGAMYRGDATNCIFLSNSANFVGNHEYSTNCEKCIFADSATLGVSDLVAMPYSGEKQMINLTANDGQILNNVPVTVKIFKGDDLVGTYSVLSGDGLIVNLGIGNYIAKFSVDGSDVEEQTRNIKIPSGTSFWDLDNIINKKYSENATINLDTDYIYEENDGDDFKDGIRIVRNVTINGNGHTIDGNGKARIFHVLGDSVVTFNNITFTNGYTPNWGYGGAILAETSPTVKAINCLFSKNNASYGGAVVRVDCENCIFIKNLAYHWGGGMYEGNATNCIFLSNSAQIAIGDKDIYDTDNDNCIFTDSATLSVNDLFTVPYSGEKQMINLTSEDGQALNNIPVTITLTKDGEDAGTYSALSGDGWIVNLAPGNYTAKFSVDGANVEEQTRDINITSGTTFMDLDYIINKKYSDNTTIYLDTDYAHEDGIGGGITINRDLTIYGNGHTINASDLTRIFFVTNKAVVTFDNITLTNGFVPENNNGGAITASDGCTVKAIHCVFRENTAGLYGGAVAGVDCEDCYFAFNKASSRDSRGGAIFNATAVNCTFMGNEAVQEGGAIYIGNATDSKFVGNNASTGGAICIGVATNCIFESNRAGTGGAIYGGNATDCTFIQNTAERDGGAISSGNAKNCSFIENTAAGGALAYGDAVDCSFNKNHASDAGGALYIANAENCNFTENTANGMGGAIYSGNAVNSIFTDNSGSSGGAIAIGNAKDSNFTGNDATSNDGGAIYKGNAVNCIFTNNHANRNGGAICIGNATDSTFTLNSANSEGGAIHGDTANDIYSSAVNCTFDKNVANYNGGAIAYGDATNCSFTGNDVSFNQGTAMFALDRPCQAVNCIFTDNNADKQVIKHGIADSCIFNGGDTPGDDVVIQNPVLHIFNFISTYNDDSILVVNVTSTSGMPIENADIKIKADVYTTGGAFVGTYNISSNGWKVPFNAGNYKVTYQTIDFESDPIEGLIVVNKENTTIKSSAVSTVYNNNKYLVITLRDSKGNPISGAKVTVTLASAKSYTTDKNGQIKINVGKVVPKTYTAKISFAGNTNYLASSTTAKVTVKKAAVKLTAKKKTFKVKVKTKKYTVTLKNNKGKVLKKVKLTLKVGKKTYKATTNSKGKATFKITKLTKKGKYTATVKFAGSKYYKALSKKVKITVKK